MTGMTDCYTDDQVIVLSAGASEPTRPTTWTEDDGLDLTGYTVTVSLGTDLTPGTWHTPATLTHPSTSSVTVTLIPPSDTPLGGYWVWIKLDSGMGTVFVRRGQHVTIS